MKGESSNIVLIEFSTAQEVGELYRLKDEHGRGLLSHLHHLYVNVSIGKNNWPLYVVSTIKYQNDNGKMLLH